jgi:hypothetical protein
VDVAAGSIVRIEGFPKIINGGAGAKYAGAGIIYVDEWRSYTPSCVASAGTITTVGAVSGRYKLWGDSCRYVANVTITTNGTGSGTLLIGTPVGQTAGTPTTVGVGRETVTQDALTATLAAASGEAVVLLYDGSYPGADGRTFCIGGEYPA